MVPMAPSATLLFALLERLNLRSVVGGPLFGMAEVSFYNLNCLAVAFLPTDHTCRAFRSLRGALEVPEVHPI